MVPSDDTYDSGTSSFGRYVQRDVAGFIALAACNAAWLLHETRRLAVRRTISTRTPAL
jgi:hypothetical protein